MGQQFINAVNEINKRDGDWALPTQDFEVHCVSNEAHILHLLKIQSYAGHPSFVGLGCAIGVIFIHDGVPVSLSFTGDAVVPVGEDNHALVLGFLDLPCLHNPVVKFRDGVAQRLFNSMNTLIRDNLSAYSWLSLGDDAVDLDGVRYADSAHGTGSRIV